MIFNRSDCPFSIRGDKSRIIIRYGTLVFMDFKRLNPLIRVLIYQENTNRKIIIKSFDSPRSKLRGTEARRLMHSYNSAKGPVEEGSLLNPAKFPADLFQGLTLGFGDHKFNPGKLNHHHKAKKCEYIPRIDIPYGNREE